ncbi:hypothetical protein FRC09_001165 [Ceratobasidium sp. 395]|nr:hypothetical protein FRC09_001165 [Ceratobasidium sp. 395]
MIITVQGYANEVPQGWYGGHPQPMVTPPHFAVQHAPPQIEMAPRPTGFDQCPPPIANHRLFDTARATIWEVSEEVSRAGTSTPRTNPQHPISPPPELVTPPATQRSIAPSKRATSRKRTIPQKPYPITKPIASTSGPSVARALPRPVSVPGPTQCLADPPESDREPFTRMFNDLKAAAASGHPAAPRLPLASRTNIAPTPFARPKDVAAAVASAIPKPVAMSLSMSHAPDPMDEDYKPLLSPAPSVESASDDLPLDFLDELAASLFGRGVDYEEEDEEDGEEGPQEDLEEGESEEEADDGDGVGSDEDEDEEVKEEPEEEQAADEEEPVKEEEDEEEESEYGEYYTGISPDDLTCLRRYLTRRPKSELKELCNRLLKRGVRVSPFQVFRALRENKVKIRTDPHPRGDRVIREDYAFKIGEHDFRSLVFIAQFNLNVRYRWAIPRRKRQGWARTQNFTISFGLSCDGLEVSTANDRPNCPYYENVVDHTMATTGRDVIILNKHQVQNEYDLKQIFKWRGGHCLFLPITCVDYNPVRLARSWIKQEIKRRDDEMAAAVDVLAVRNIIDDILGSITKEHARQWFERCNYI